MHETTCRKQKRQSAITAPINTDQKASSKPELFRKKALTSILSLRTKGITEPHAKAFDLQEVLARASPACWDRTPVIGHSAEYLKVWLEVLAERHDGGDVAAAVAVVGR